MGNVVPIKGAREAPKSAQNRMETLIVSLQEAETWKIPPFQRPLRVNQKVIDVAETLKTSESIEGVLTLGKVAKDAATYIVDGQHRVEAFKLSGLSEVIADIRLLVFPTLSEMADEFVRLNSSLVKMGPDDILRGLENSVSSLATIREACDFVGYGQVRRGDSSGPVVSMSTVLRCWVGSAMETPVTTSFGKSIGAIAQSIDAQSVKDLTVFLLTAHAAWGREPENYRLWGALNMTLCMWLWRRLVLDRVRPGTVRYVVLSVAEFKQCLMSVSADADYVAWLVGRNMSDRDRSPAFARLKRAFAGRIAEIGRGGGKKQLLPQPAWSSK